MRQPLSKDLLIWKASTTRFVVSLRRSFWPTATVRRAEEAKRERYFLRWIRTKVDNSASEMKQFISGFFLDLGVEEEDELEVFHSRLMEQIDRDGNGFIDLDGDDN